jgi:hypothetical protein
MTTLPDCMMPDGAEPCTGYQEMVAALGYWRNRVQAAEAGDSSLITKCIANEDEIDRLRKRAKDNMAEAEQWRGRAQKAEATLMNSGTAAMQTEIAKLKAALEEASDLAVALCAQCRQNIGDKQFLVWAHDEIGVAIINIRNKALGDEE